MNIEENHKKEYVEAYSHIDLAKQLGTTLALLDSHADAEGWKEEHRLYWFDKSIESLKYALNEGSIPAVKELLKLSGLTRPVGRPKKIDIEHHLAVQAKIADEWEADIQRLKLVENN
jgi:hypothetical protein